MELKDTEFGKQLESKANLLREKKQTNASSEPTPKYKAYESHQHTFDQTVKRLEKEQEYRNWLKPLATMYVANIEDASEDESVIWLQGLANRTDDNNQMQKIAALANHPNSMKTDGESHAILYNWFEWINMIREAKKEKKIRLSPISIRGLDYDLYKEARSQSIREGKNIGQWINEAIEKKLNKSK